MLEEKKSSSVTISTPVCLKMYSLLAKILQYTSFTLKNCLHLISPGTWRCPKRNLKQCLCKFWRVKEVYYGICASREGEIRWPSLLGNIARACSKLVSAERKTQEYQFCINLFTSDQYRTCWNNCLPNIADIFLSGKEYVKNQSHALSL